MKSSYKPQDVKILLKDITGLVEPLDSSVREKFIQSGVHYSEMLPKEHSPSPEYLEAYYEALKAHAGMTAAATGAVAEKIYKIRNKKPVLVSLARAGTPIGILIKHYIEWVYNIDVPHYTISIIRGKGIDNNAVKYILERHKPENIQFVDGWTGKGAIQRQLNEAMKAYPELDPRVAVLSDAAGVTDIYGTREDFLIASSCLNSTVSGLISRTFYRDDIIGRDDFHGAMYYSEFESEDLTYEFISAVESEFSDSGAEFIEKNDSDFDYSYDEAQKIADSFGITDINLVKPGIGETTRVLLRRVPWKILVHSLDDHVNLGHIYRLASEKGVPVEEYPLKKYKSCGLIRKLADN